ncbi:hypothetical protein [Granulicella arctica]|nr:hypothetical protein [Granulicella arctica]
MQELSFELSYTQPGPGGEDVDASATTGDDDSKSSSGDAVGAAGLKCPRE